MKEKFYAFGQKSSKLKIVDWFIARNFTVCRSLLLKVKLDKKWQNIF
jgi:hypothetical protein